MDRHPLTQRLGKSRCTDRTFLVEEVDTSADVSNIHSNHLLDPLHLDTFINVLQWFQPLDLPSMKVVVWGAKRSGKTSIIYRWKLGTFIPTVPTIGLLEECHEHQNPYFKCNVRVNLFEIGRDPISVEMRTVPLQSSSRCSSDSDDSSGDEDSDSFYGRSRRRRQRYRNCCASLSRCCRCLFCARRKERSQAIDFAVQVWTKIVKKANAVVYVVDSSCKVSLLEMFDDLNLILHNDHLKSQNARFLILANKQDVWGAVSATEIEKMLNIPKPLEKRCKVLPCSALTGENLDVALCWLEEWISVANSNLQMMSL